MVAISSYAGLYIASARNKKIAFLLVCITIPFTLGVEISVKTILKVSVGRLRPDFLARCQIDPTGAEQLNKEQLSKFHVNMATNYPCTGNRSEIIEGRRSFPSGHASLAAYSAFLATSFCIMRSIDFQKRLKSRYRLRNDIITPIVTPLPSDKPASVSLEEGNASFESTIVPADITETIRLTLLQLFIKVLCGSLAVIPVYLSLWIAASRITDNRHHPTDVLFGYLCGIVCGLSSLAFLSLESPYLCSSNAKRLTKSL